VARAARRAGIPVHAVCGRSELDAGALADSGFASVRALAELEPDPAVSMANAGELLTRLSEDLMTELITASGTGAEPAGAASGDVGS
ncbi:glycerate kinase, partial [Bacillus licheniformis]|uniref:glycerate kinase n=1 Tax=Bacillus licheniformis TaxID=1402 RepID=UPI00232BA4AA